ncbi:MAG: hypothetical protein E7005_06035 [Alphaproteobacteria bacterium]|nr:hypothetical protein [Alphaproteobacteria bacterium]
MAYANKKNTNTNIEDESTLKRFLWLQKNFLYCFVLTAIIWVVGLCYYIENFIGWSSVLSLPPRDFGEFLFYSITPLLLVWFILAYIDRSASVNASSKLLQMYMNSLMYPDDDATKNAKAFSNILNEQIKQLQKGGKDVGEQTITIEKELGKRVEELANILQVLDTYSAKTINELNDGVKSLADKCSYITDKTTNTIVKMKQCSEDISQNSDNFVSKLNPMLDEITAISSNIKNNISDNKLSLNEMKGQLEACAEISKQHIDELLAKSSENTQRISKSFYKTAEECDALYKRLDMGISGVEGKVEEQKRLIEAQTQVLDHNSELLSNKLSRYGQTVTAEIDKLVKNSVELETLTKKQIQTLKAVNSETGKAIQGIGYTFDEKRAEIERKSEYAINSMQNVILAINKETEKLMSFTNLTQAKNQDLQNIAETIVDKVGDISGKLALKTDALKDKAVEVIEKFTQASEIINQNTDKISNSTNQLMTNSKQSLSLWEEQKDYIDNALHNIDIISEKLHNLQSGVKDTSKELDGILSGYDKQIDKYKELEVRTKKFEPTKPQIDKSNLIKLSSGINKTLIAQNIKVEQFFSGIDMLDLWEDYLNGKNSVFVDILSKTLSKKLLMIIRKDFDDNAEFHNLVIKYLFAMETLIKEANNPTSMSRDEILNMCVKNSLDKIYFTLIKALNSAE